MIVIMENIKNGTVTSYLLVTEQNNEFLMKNHNLRSNGFTLLLEVNGTEFSKANATSSHRYGHGRGHARTRDRDRFHGGGRNNYTPNVLYRNTLCHHKWINIEKKQAKCNAPIPQIRRRYGDVYTQSENVITYIR